MNLFKDLKICYFATAFGGIFLDLILCEMMHWGMLVFWIIVLPFIFGCVYWFQKKAQERVNRMINMMHMECRIQDFIDAYLPLYERCNAPWQKKNMCLMLSGAYLNMGDSEKGMKYLEEFLRIDTKKTLFLANETKREKLIVTQQAIYHNNMVVSYLRQDDLEKAEEMLEALKKDISVINAEAPEVDKKVFQRACKLKEIVIALKREDYSDYLSKEQYLKDVLEDVNSELERVNYRAVLYNLYTGVSELEKAEECRAYVLAHGGDSYYKKTMEMY